MHLCATAVWAPQTNFAHLDYTWGEDAHTFVYSGVVQQLAKYNPVKGAAAASPLLADA
jgi:hypothetical protein